MIHPAIAAPPSGTESSAQVVEAMMVVAVASFVTPRELPWRYTGPAFIMKTMPMATIREATALDLPFLEEMLYEAFFWDGGAERPTLVEMRARPEFHSLLADWGRPGDVAWVALTAGEKAGAAWFRSWTPEAHSYGFVDSQTPELGIGVARSFRGQGLGRQLLRALLESARQQAYRQLSLSVAPANPARALYESEGFRKVAEVGTSWTMLRELPKWQREPPLDSEEP